MKFFSRNDEQHVTENYDDHGSDEEDSVDGEDSDEDSNYDENGMPRDLEWIMNEEDFDDDRIGKDMALFEDQDEIELDHVDADSIADSTPDDDDITQNLVKEHGLAEFMGTRKPGPDSEPILQSMVEDEELLPGFDGKDTPLSDEYDQNILLDPTEEGDHPQVVVLPTDLPDYGSGSTFESQKTAPDLDALAEIEESNSFDGTKEEEDGVTYDLALINDDVVPQSNSFEGTEEKEDGDTYDLALINDDVVPHRRRMASIVGNNHKLRQKARVPQLETRINGVNDQLTALTVIAGFVAFITFFALVTIRRRV